MGLEDELRDGIRRALWMCGLFCGSFLAARRRSMTANTVVSRVPVTGSNFALSTAIPFSWLVNSIPERVYR